MWRDDHCYPPYHIYCVNPYTPLECSNTWNCSEIDAITEDVWNAYNTNFDD
jgi:hypothetical protein